jgi:hypothetical protein
MVIYNEPSIALGNKPLSAFVLAIWNKLVPLEVAMNQLENTLELGVVVAVANVASLWLSKLPFKINWAEALEENSAAMAPDVIKKRRKAEEDVVMFSF